jgi:hypothetical protein
MGLDLAMLSDESGRVVMAHVQTGKQDANDQNKTDSSLKDLRRRRTGEPSRCLRVALRSPPKAILPHSLQPPLVIDRPHLEQHQLQVYRHAEQVLWS